MAANGVGVHISWPTVGVVLAMAIALATGAIQLGSVQTHVMINTDRISLAEVHERANIVELATLKAQQQMIEERVKALEAQILLGRTRDETLTDRVSRIEAQSMHPRQLDKP